MRDVGVGCEEREWVVISGMMGEDINDILDPKYNNDTD